jgi:hypothetical protein
MLYNINTESVVKWFTEGKNILLFNLVILEKEMQDEGKIIPVLN